MDLEMQAVSSAPNAANDDKEMYLDIRHRKDLEESGLTPATIAASGGYSADGATIKRLLKWGNTMPTPSRGLVLSYPGANGYCQIKLDEPRLQAASASTIAKAADHAQELNSVLGGGQEDVDEPKMIKYEKPMGMATHIYIPASVRAKLTDPSEQLWITEGEKKAILGCQLNLAMVAVPGVWCFGDAEANRLAKGQGDRASVLHPDLRLLVKGGREVVLCLDSDVDRNPDIVRALATAVKLLSGEGADVKITYLPSVGEKRVGLDDYFVGLPPEDRCSEDPLYWLRESARPANVYDVLDWLSEKWDDWSEKQQKRELARAAKLARHILPDPLNSMPEWTRKASKALDITQKSIAAVAPAMKVEKAEKNQTARVWLAKWITKIQASYCYGSEAVAVAGVEMAPDAIRWKLFLDADEAKEAPPGRTLEYALNEWTQGQKEVFREMCRAKIKYQPLLGDGELARFVEAVTGKIAPLDVAVVKHFVWQVKRKLHGQPVEHHLMPILVGSQNVGKTAALRALCAPIADLCDSPSDLTFLGDERQNFRLAKSHIILLDEMGYADRVSVDVLKNKITADRLSWRILGSNKQTSSPNVATFVGASNKQLLDLIYDPTGMRRFYEVECAKKMNWEQINGINYTNLWASVDPSGLCPIKPYLAELDVVQEAYRGNDSVEEFVRLCDSLQAWTGSRSLFQSYLAMCNATNQKALNEARWGRRMMQVVEKKVGGDGIGWKDSNGKKYHLSVEKNCYLTK